MKAIKNIYYKLIGGDSIQVLQDGLILLESAKYLGFENFQNMQLITEDWPVGETRNLEGTANTLLERSKSKIQFRTVMPQGGGMPKQWHLMWETCKIIKGELMDELHPSTIYRAGDIAIFPPEFKHRPINPSRKLANEIIVTFTARKP